MSKIKNCKIIYAPQGQAGEYSELAINPYKGCGHKCAYCYVPGVLRISREQFDSGATERENFRELLIKDARKYQSAGIRKQVMMSFTTDPYHPFDTTLTTDCIKILHQHNLGICTLTKGGKRVLRDIELFNPETDAFATTLTMLTDSESLKWERGASLPKERMETLQIFHSWGIFTWVSLEPTISIQSSLEIVRRTHEYVDLYKIGRANYLPITSTTDWRKYTEKMLELVQELGVKHYFKKDLQQYLPEGYHNPKHIPQTKDTSLYRMMNNLF